MNNHRQSNQSFNEMNELELLNKSQEYFLHNTEVSVKEIDCIDPVMYDKY